MRGRENEMKKKQNKKKIRIIYPEINASIPVG